MTSHPIRTSPVFRGKWILNNILGTPPPDPPPNVPPLPEQRTQAKMQSMRERMAQHRANPVCATCHTMIDPLGFALENFDAIGRWRTVDESFNPIDASGVLPDGTKFNGVAELRAALVRRPERFVATVTEKLLTYALGRGLEHYDMPAVRRIVPTSAQGRLQVPDAHPRNRQELSVLDAKSGEREPATASPRGSSERALRSARPYSREERVHGHHEDGAAPADVPARHGRGDRAAAARRDGAGASRGGAAPRRQRLGFFYVPNGMYLPNFHPDGVGDKDFEFTPVLKPLEPFREQVIVVSGLSNLGVISPNEGGGVHTRAHAGWLNGVLPKHTEGADIKAGKTIDQYAADKLGADTPLRSLELTTDSTSMVGNCENGYSCAYLNSTSWRTPTTPLPHESNPRVVFQRMFGDGGSVTARLAQMRRTAASSIR